MACLTVSVHSVPREIEKLKIPDTEPSQVECLCFMNFKYILHQMINPTLCSNHYSLARRRVSQILSNSDMDALMRLLMDAPIYVDFEACDCHGMLPLGVHPQFFGR